MIIISLSYSGIDSAYKTGGKVFLQIENAQKTIKIINEETIIEFLLF